MDFTVSVLLGTFLLSIAALFIFIWSMSKGLFGDGVAAATEIFGKNELGTVEDPAATALQKGDLQRAMGAVDEHMSDEEEEIRARADRSTSLVVGVCLTLAVMWLVLASLAGLISSIKLHSPDWLVQYAWLTFGRIRPIHLNLIAYGWCSLAGIGVAIWLIPRLLKTELVGAKYALVGGALWTVGVFAGVVAIAMGYSDGLEWLEFPWQIDILLVAGGALVGCPLWLTLLQRKVDHLYVSVWYIGAGLLWFPILFLVANWPGLHFGVQQATMNWWFGHNVLGLWFTPLGLAASYYFIPKVLGKPIHSYNLSLLGFWSLAFFYSQVGGHHLIGGPIPSWLVTISIVQSMMMAIPVFAVAVNQHMTVLGNFRALAYSPTLRFIVLGAMMYTAASIQGSMEALRAVNTITHFTHYTVAHAHLGLYGFFSMVMFGSIYFIMPRVMNWEWPYPKLISLHFWLVLIGFAIYFIWLSIGGWLQGLAMLDKDTTFMQSVAITLPYLEARSIGGGLMTLGHLVFAAHFFAMGWKFGPKRLGAALLSNRLLSRLTGKGATA
ncbi:cbb3-type cytochrome c oxidase subunit I [Actimicrobium sp. CCC2.4]|uniref:cbb3-type cytochrome c oxidase subunit I n=1 Tax=Actimicrobium sp. CCC2.4 TaxID=3048606 RepID=UPI002AC92085|nr:cbb3-type cytochrome c oxidase subunit I [Actimicrobium sp. CCC2.4]MEB0135150.1 cbb3-type cytochrome c oxidase subunit I [Actimicrobium sp. CCC2.4]WPX30948.1 cbb3-type cytochrome c oxidase subunit I [Actimicrobium sp. CCC2.4]